MRMKLWLAILVSMLLSFSISSLSGSQPLPEYSAESTMETADSATESTIYVIPGMERRESLMDGEKSIMIIRHDKKVMWTLMPSEKMYMEMQLGVNSGRKDDLSAYKIEHTAVGPDTVNGVKTTKSKLIMIGPNGQKLGGFMWTTNDGIVVKMDAISVDKNSKERFKTELRNLKIGKQDRSLFEIPADYTKMDMGGFGGMGMGNGSGGQSHPSRDNSEKKGFSFKDAIDLMK